MGKVKVTWDSKLLLAITYEKFATLSTCKLICGTASPSDRRVLTPVSLPLRLHTADMKMLICSHCTL